MNSRAREILYSNGELFCKFLARRWGCHRTIKLLLSLSLARAHRKAASRIPTRDIKFLALSLSQEELREGVLEKKRPRRRIRAPIPSFSLFLSQYNRVAESELKEFRANQESRERKLFGIPLAEERESSTPLDRIRYCKRPFAKRLLREKNLAGAILSLSSGIFFVLLFRLYRCCSSHADSIA